MTTLAKFGIIYVATGARYLQEAHLNAKFSKCLATQYPFAIYTDLVDDVDNSLFDFKFLIESPSFSYHDKIKPLINLPFEKCLFLDTDARLIYSPDDLFILLDTFDVCASHAPVRIPPGWVDHKVPLSFPELNTGVLLLKNNSSVISLISHWLDLFSEIHDAFSQSWDQATFRSCLYSYISQDKIIFSILPSECNLRTTKPWIAGRGSPVYVIHGRYDSSEVDNFIDFLNSDIDKFRTFSDWCLLYPDTTIRPRFDRTYD